MDTRPFGIDVSRYDGLLNWGAVEAHGPQVQGRLSTSMNQLKHSMVSNGGTMDGYKLVLDVSHHQTFNYDEVKKHVDGVIIRFGFGTTGDTLSDKHYDGFKEIPCAGYQWFRPDQDVKAQIELVKVKTDKKNIRVFFSDNEQHGHWVWNTDVAPFYTADQLSEFARAHVEGLALHGFDMGIYTRATWVDQYARPMWQWMFQYHNWLASWPFGKDAVTTTWENLKSTWAPKLFSPYYTANWPSRSAAAWQWSGDKFILPGVFTNSPTPKPRTVDLNYVSDALFYRMSGAYQEPVTQPPTFDLQNLHNELTDLRNSMEVARAELTARMSKDIKELEYIMELVKRGG